MRNLVSHVFFSNYVLTSSEFVFNESRSTNLEDGKWMIDTQERGCLQVEYKYS